MKSNEVLQKDVQDAIKWEPYRQDLRCLYLTSGELFSDLQVNIQNKLNY